MWKPIFISVLFVFLSTSQAADTFCTKLVENGVTERICCTGYKWDGTVCAVFCSNGCVNGKCAAPELCECNEGFAKRGDWRSPCERVPTDPQQQLCHDRCINGTYSDGACTCELGWLLQQDESGDICVPQCEENSSKSNGGCVSGFCRAPGNWVCFEGFEPASTNELENVPAMEGISWGNMLANWLHKLLSLWPQYHWYIIAVAITLTIVLLATCHLFYYKCRGYLYHRMEEKQSEHRSEQFNKNKPLIAYM